MPTRHSRQSRVILCGFVVILLMGLFPPWMATGSMRSEGYRFLFVYHPWERIGERVDTSFLLCQWFLVLAVTGIIVMCLGGSSPESHRQARRVEGKDQP